MLPEFFVQTEYNVGPTESIRVKALLFSSYAVKIASTSFAVLAAIFSMWYLFGLFGLYAIGIILRQSVLQREEAYEYFLVHDRLKISIRNNFHQQKQMVDIDMKDIKSIEAVKAEKCDKGDIFAAPEGKTIIKIRFNENGVTKNLYFAPSRYLLALIQKRRVI